ncbi:uncharacterized protein TA08430 [Theileria annulata]|uniref:Uncharacterized protein n=1 Tax=Theileria annulata TaxID=5874 RepID=Q4U9M8_THEAN|nr:uncharacterized protein TA08430 [Theileria annulata]CAI76475.1 hypothetical protein, conserved [Theileria annulata]|eukprot:XP_953100.1 hypothetical protein, conserved [Theileria annulata]
MEEFIKIWPKEYGKKFYINFDGRFYTDKAHRYNIFYNTEWKELNLEIRGNCLLACDASDQSMGTECGPVMGWILEHVNFKLGIPAHFLTLPSDLDLKSLDDSSIIYIHEKDDPDQAFLAIFCQSKEDTDDLFDRLRQCSLTVLKSVVGKSFYNSRPGYLALQEKTEITTNIAINRLESLKYEHEFLKKHQENLKLDNTLLLTQSNLNNQLYSEGMQLQLQENSHLKNELEQALNEILQRDESIKNLKNDLKSCKQIMSSRIESNEALKQELDSTNSAIDEANMIPEKKLRALYTKKAKQANILSLKLLSSKYDNSKLVAKYHSLKNEMKDELHKIQEFVESYEIYDLLKLWIFCNELKVEYYENLPDLNFDERNRLLEKYFSFFYFFRINKTQSQLNIAMVIARATYITYRTLIFDEVLNSFSDDNPTTFRTLHDIINSVSFIFIRFTIEMKFSWIFQPESVTEDSSDPVWINNIKMTKLVEKTLYHKDRPIWFDRVSFSSAIRPVVSYDQDNKAELEIKKRLFYCLEQNSQLRQKIRSMSKQMGNDSHWKSLWRRTNARKKSSNSS